MLEVNRLAPMASMTLFRRRDSARPGRKGFGLPFSENADKPRPNRKPAHTL